MKRIVVLLLIALTLLPLGACKKGVKILHCDRCGREVQYPADSNVTGDWIIVCSECRKKMDSN